MLQCVSLIQSQQDVFQTQTNKNKCPQKIRAHCQHGLFSLHSATYLRGETFAFECAPLIGAEERASSCQPGAESGGRRQLTGVAPLILHSVGCVCRLSEDDSRHTQHHVTLLFVWPVLMERIVQLVQGRHYTVKSRLNKPLVGKWKVTACRFGPAR